LTTYRYETQVSNDFGDPVVLRGLCGLRDYRTVIACGRPSRSAGASSSISGHKQLATLQQYVKPNQDAVAKLVAKLMADTDPARRGK
jgi:hypothetical protein